MAAGTAAILLEQFQQKCEAVLRLELRGNNDLKRTAL